MIKTKKTHVIKFRNYDVLDALLKRYVYADTKEGYVSSFEEKESEAVFKIWNMNGLTGEEYFTEFKSPLINIKSVWDLEANTYLTSKTAG